MKQIHGYRWVKLALQALTTPRSISGWMVCLNCRSNAVAIYSIFILQIDRRTWYYFGYTRGVMQIHSSNNEFLDRMKKLKPNERRQECYQRRILYLYGINRCQKRIPFLRRYREVLKAGASSKSVINNVTTQRYFAKYISFSLFSREKLCFICSDFYHNIYSA